MLETIYTVFILILKIFSIYFGLIAIFSMFGKKKEKLTNKKLRFAVLIAARNEESCISGIIDSLKHQEYPNELIDIFVIPNKCIDNTATVAKESGAYVMEAPENVKYKGGALQFAMDKLLKSENQYDVFLVFDADNEAAPEFVSSMNQTLCNGARVAKSRILAKNREDSWVAMCYDIHFCTANLFLNRARVRIGLSARLIGTGFAVTTDYLREIGGFNTITITEDAEFFAICAAHGEKIAFCENAITYDEQSLEFKTSIIQRKRWMSGIMQVLILKFKDLSKGLFRGKSAKYSFDTLVQFSFAYVQALIPFALLLAIINSPSTFIVNSLPIIMLKGYLFVLLTAFIVLILEKRLSYSPNVIAGIFMYPFFVLSFIPLQTVSLFKKTLKWEAIKHTSISSETNSSTIKTRKRWRNISFTKKIIIPLKRVATYARNFGVSVIIDISIFAIIVYLVKPILGTGSAIVIASVIARTTSSLINFSLNKALFIGENIGHKSFIVKYYILWVCLLTLSATMTYILNDIFVITEVVAKIISDICLGLLSYQIQMRWVFSKKSRRKTRGLYFRVVRKILQLFLKREMNVDKKIFMTGNVLVGHHQNFYGPITCLLWLPDTVNIWVVSHLFNFKECFGMYYNLTFKKTIKLPKVVAFIMATLCALLIPPLLKSARAIPVYRESKDIMKTFNLSMELLNKGEQILIFPNIEYNDNSHIMGEIYTGFTHLEKLYYRSNNEHLGFVSIIIDKTTGIITNSDTVFFDDDKPYKVEKDIVVKQIIDNINLEYYKPYHPI